MLMPVAGRLWVVVPFRKRGIILSGLIMLFQLPGLSCSLVGVDILTVVLHCKLCTVSTAHRLAFSAWRTNIP